MKKTPTLCIYWADTEKLLTYSERSKLNGDTRVVAMTPLEVLLMVPSGRKVVIVGVGDEKAKRLMGE